jgi:hypothetical protein
MVSRSPAATARPGGKRRRRLVGAAGIEPRAVPGAHVHLRQKSPAFVLALGETTLAVDPAIAGEIYVKKV